MTTKERSAAALLSASISLSISVSGFPNGKPLLFPQTFQILKKANL
jgi:hypothetical protein